MTADTPPLFYPPRQRPVLLRLLQSVAPPLAAQFYKLRLRVADADVDRLRQLSEATLLLVPNHPTFQDPIVMFLLSGRVGTLLHFLAAYELFKGGLRSVFQMVGVYSIRRAMLDRASVAQTLELLSTPGARVVVFAEGGVSFQNDTVMPFRVGAIQIAFQALVRAAKRGEVLPPLYVVPVSIKYRYTQDQGWSIEASLGRLERELGIVSSQGDGSQGDGSQGDWYGRLRAIAQRVIGRLEQEYGLGSEVELDWNSRMGRLRQQVLNRCERQLGINANVADPVRERAYRIAEVLRVQADRLEAGLIVSPEPSGPLRAESERLSLEQIERSVFRLLNFDAIYDGYVAENPTQERFLDTLIRLERDVFRIDQPRPKGFRDAWVRVGEPLDLRMLVERYQGDRGGTIEAVTQQLHRAVQDQLDQLNRSTLSLD